MARYLRPNSVRNINFININDLNFDRPATIADVKQETIAPSTTEKTFNSIVNIADVNIVNSLQVDGNAILFPSSLLLSHYFSLTNMNYHGCETF
jgi:hypothetical protein